MKTQRNRPMPFMMSFRGGAPDDVVYDTAQEQTEALERMYGVLLARRAQEDATAGSAVDLSQ